MPTRSHTALVCLLLFCHLGLAASAVAQVPTTLSYQGRLLDDAGQAVAGPVDVVVSLWTEATGGTQLWTESWIDVPLSNGVFSLLLGSNGSPLDPADFQGDSSLYLQLEIDGEVLLPRQVLGSTPFALVDEPGNELQDLSLTGDELSLSGSASTVDLSVYLDDTDDQDLALSGNTLTLTNDATPVGLAAYLDDTDDQQLSLAGTLLALTDGGAVDLSGIGQIAPDSLDFDDLADALTADATTTIDLDTNAADLDLDAATLFVDSSEDRVGIGTATPAVALDVNGDVRATGTITADGGMDLGMGSLDQLPGDPALAGSLPLGDLPISVFVSGRYAYVVDQTSDDLSVIDVSDPSDPFEVGSLGIGDLPISVFVSGRYAYVVDAISVDLKVIDVSVPSAPALAGSLGIGGGPRSVFVSGRYAYVVDVVSDDLKVIDVADPSAPMLAGSLPFGGSPHSVYVSGRYAYVVRQESRDLSVIDVSDPSDPALTGSLGLGFNPVSVFVSGRYAYVVDAGTNDLRVIDVSVPSAPALAGSLGIGGGPQSVFVSGRYAYVVDAVSDDIKVVDVSVPSAPALAGSLGIGDVPESAFVSGRYAYVVDSGSDDLKVIDLTGAEFSSAIVHSLEAGSLQVRESATVQGQLQVTGGATIGPGGLFSDGNVGIDGTLALATDIAPTSSPGNAILLYAEGGTAELKVRDEAGNVTVLSPHNFSLAGKPSEPLAWSYYSENEDHGRINVDMLRTVRLVEKLSGERLVHAQAADGSPIASPADSEAGLRAEVEELRRTNEELRRKSEQHERENRRLALELARIQEVLGMEALRIEPPGP